MTFEKRGSVFFWWFETAMREARVPQSGWVVQREAADWAVSSSSSLVLMPLIIRASTCWERASGFTARPLDALRIRSRTLSNETASREPLRF